MHTHMISHKVQARNGVQVSNEFFYLAPRLRRWIDNDTNSLLVENVNEAHNLLPRFFVRQVCGLDIAVVATTLCPRPLHTNPLEVVTEVPRVAGYHQ